jgi:mannose-6-phosphate isomerase-like protein (cupin superfamily)
MTDIVVRYMSAEQVTMEARRLEHRNVFWPAWHRLPALRPMVFALLTRVQAVELGSILITKLPPNREIEPHSDAGNWAPAHYNTKCHITLAGSALVRCEDEAITFVSGTIWTFDNLLTHSIENTGECDRIVCIVSMRCE